MRVVGLLVLCACAYAALENMNGDYVLSPTGGANASETKRLFPTNFKDYPNGVESFDVYSPTIKSLYSQVFWTSLPAVDIPADIVKKYDGKGMAVVGFEVDQVRRTPKGDVSVPINVAYNHHFESTMIGKKSNFRKITFSGPDDPRIAQLDMGHGLASHTEAWVVETESSDETGGLPSSQSFGAANGGEYRKSFHGYAPGFVQVIESPTKFQITPMQIDTWNRDKMNITGGPFVAGPLPRNSLAAKGAAYSGLLECPVTTRLRKLIPGGYKMAQTGHCKAPITTASECFQAAASSITALNFTNKESADPARPQGCSAVIDQQGMVTVSFNKGAAGAACGAGTTTLAGQISSLVELSINLDLKQQEATITLSGPSDVWWGIGFNATQMKDDPWSIIVDGTGAVTEHRLADQGAIPTTTALKPSIKVLSNTVKGSQRTVVVSRGFVGPSAEYYSFTAQSNIPVITAVGAGAKLAYHKNKEPTSITLLPAGSDAAGTCICASKAVPFGQQRGTLEYISVKSQPADTGTGKVGWGNSCPPQPRGDLLAQHNPTCDIRTYTGGQIACHHMWSLLDADQEIPWVDQPLEYSLKFRFWVQEYNASRHQQVKRTTWGIGSPVEYDVPKCAPGMMGCEQKADGNWVHTITGTFKGGGKLVAAHYHCHAPTCLSVAIYRNDTGELLCKEEPLYGGSGKMENPSMEEPGFIAQPPCLWGSPEQGLQEPVDVNGVTLHAVKTANATSGHHGEMAWLQMFYY